LFSKKILDNGSLGDDFDLTAVFSAIKPTTVLRFRQLDAALGIPVTMVSKQIAAVKNFGGEVDLIDTRVLSRQARVAQLAAGILQGLRRKGKNLEVFAAEPALGNDVSQIISQC